MSEPSASKRLTEIADEFADLEPRERLELLLEFAHNLPTLPAELQSEKERAAHRVHECQTPVFLWVSRDGDRVRIVADVADESPTVKGFVSVLVSALSGARLEEALTIEPNLVSRLKLAETLGMVRARGLQAVQFYIRKQLLTLSV